MLGTGNYDINVIMSALNSRYVRFHLFSRKIHDDLDPTKPFGTTNEKKCLA